MAFPASWTTDRLAAERLTEAHFDDLLAMHQDSAQMAMLGGVMGEEATRAYLARNLAHWAEYNFGLWMVRLRASGLIVGRGMLRTLPLDGMLEMEVGYSFGPALWGQGLGTEIAWACMHHGRETLGWRTLVAIVHPDNVASHRVLEKVGMRFDRVLEWSGTNRVLYRWREGDRQEAR